MRQFKNQSSSFQFVFLHKSMRQKNSRLTLSHYTFDNINYISQDKLWLTQPWTDTVFDSIMSVFAQNTLSVQS